ncbi:MAG: iron-sulfur cluster co-chaperone HscB C-terminal domain-containing protein [Saprospiraceae bacterium]|nr:iron-sulfur cluster co-chaperone HscB C-terminal domain-containing protein [Saprospiraceae bacterium]
MNYFEFFKIPVSFNLNEAELKKAFYSNSKKFHPDFFTLESKEKQMEVLELSTLNNNAFKTLSNFDKRMKYILELKEVLGEEGKNKIPQEFLMEMMEINENLMELEFDFDKNNFDKIQNSLKKLESILLEEVNPYIENYNDAAPKEVELDVIKNYFLKKRYLLRIKENLNKFASL